MSIVVEINGGMICKPDTLQYLYVMWMEIKLVAGLFL
jgi:hypothetical protein